MNAIRGKMKVTCLVALLASLSIAAPALAQTKPDSEALLEAIQEQRNNDIVDLVTRKGRAIVNVRGYSGVTPLTAAMRARSAQYVSYLLANGADPNFAEKSGDTALMIATRLGYAEGVARMIDARAAIDATNRQGETALIIAVQNRQLPLVKKLLEAGASASKTDNASGLSARDYAVRDRRSGEILRLIDSVKAKPKFIAGPIIH